LTGRPIAFAVWVAWLMKSCSILRPSPPPRNVVWSVTWSAASPVIVVPTAIA